MGEKQHQDIQQDLHQDLQQDLQREGQNPVDLRQLESLLAVDEAGSFSAAAETLLTVQSNVSTRVARLEAELGVRLVDRNNRSLTAEGRVVAARARVILAGVAAIPSDLAALQDRITGEVLLGIIASSARWVVPVLLAHVHEHLPDVELRITEAASNNTAGLVSGGELDLGIVNLPVETTALDASPLFSEEILLVVPPTHALAESLQAGATITINDLEEVELFAPPVGASYRDALDDAFAREGHRMNVVAEFEGIRLIESLAAEGIGAAFLPATATPRGHSPTPTSVTGIQPREVGVIKPKGRRLSIAAEAVRAVIHEVVSAKAPSLRGVALP